VARAILNSELRIGSKKMPVQLFSAVQDRSVRFHLLDRKTEERVKQHMLDPSSEDPVPSTEIRKGYEIENGDFVILTDEDLDSVQPKASKEIEVEHFVAAGQIPQALYERPYYLGPRSDSSSYFALAEALAASGREGLARWVMRGKEYLGSLQSRDGYLQLITLRYADEVLSPRELPAPEGRDFDARELKMAEQLVQALKSDFDPADFHDEYRERLMHYIEQKARGRKPRLASIPSKKPSGSLVDALSASLKSAAKGKRKAVA
jgi:DNA end-binding protein Ku